MKKYLVLLLKKLRALSSVAIRLRGVHPKHLVETREFWIKKYLDKNDVVLDLGCSGGERDFKIAGLCKSIIGVDYDRKSIEDAVDKSKKYGLNNVEFINKDIFDYLTGVRLMGKSLPRQFDKIILIDVLEHVLDRKKLLNNIHASLKADGLFFISVPNKNTSWKKFQKSAGVNYFTDPDHKTEYAKEEIKAELREAGFKIVEMKPDVIDTPWAPIFDLIGGFSLEMYKKLLKWKRDQVLIHPEEASGWEITVRKI